MRLLAKDILKKKAEPTKISADDMDPIMSQQAFPSETESMSPSGRTRLEHDYLTNGLEYGDRLRVVGDNGVTYDVILMPNNTIGVQEVKYTVDYSAPTNAYRTWEEAEAAIPQGYSVNKGIKT
jgi:hypothetical protein